MKKIKSTRKSRKLNKGLIKEQEGKERIQVVEYLFQKFKNKEKGVIDFESLLRAMVSNDLIDKVDEKDIENMISFYTDKESLDENDLKRIFDDCKINLNTFK